MYMNICIYTRVARERARRAACPEGALAHRGEPCPPGTPGPVLVWT